jgi:hypothetical protein
MVHSGAPMNSAFTSRPSTRSSMVSESSVVHPRTPTEYHTGRSM